MPIHTGQDKNGQFYQWGKTGKKYYFSNEQTKKAAKRKAEKQQTAIYSSGWKGDSFMKLIRINKKDASDKRITKKFGKVEAAIDPEGQWGKYYLIGESQFMNGESFKIAQNNKEGAENIDKYIRLYKQHIKELEQAKKWFLEN